MRQLNPSDASSTFNDTSSTYAFSGQQSHSFHIKISNSRRYIHSHHGCAQHARDGEGRQAKKGHRSEAHSTSCRFKLFVPAELCWRRDEQNSAKPTLTLLVATSKITLGKALTGDQKWLEREPVPVARRCVLEREKAVGVGVPDVSGCSRPSLVSSVILQLPRPLIAPFGFFCGSEMYLCVHQFLFVIVAGCL